MGEALTEERRIYEQLWNKTGALLKSGQLRFDPGLRNKTGDLRRGVTLVARPDAGVRQKVESFLRKAAGICPRQYFYQPAELHVTVMAIVPNSESWKSEIRALPTCQRILEEVLRGHYWFRVDFTGVTVAPDAVMIQGFPMDDALARLRDEIRDAFGKHGLGKNLDRRYKTTTAHLTVMRFSEPEEDWGRLYDFLQAYRETNFGKAHFQSLQLIWGDWYASAEIVRTLQEYPLQD